MRIDEMVMISPPTTSRSTTGEIAICDIDGTDDLIRGKWTLETYPKIPTTIEIPSEVDEKI
jgi:hypothetical protein